MVLENHPGLGARTGSQEWDAATPSSPRPPAPLLLFPPSSAAARTENGPFHWERRFMWLPGASGIIRILGVALITWTVWPSPNKYEDYSSLFKCPSDLLQTQVGYRQLPGWKRSYVIELSHSRDQEALTECLWNTFDLNFFFSFFPATQRFATMAQEMAS